MSTNVHYTESLLGVEQFESLRACMVAVGHFYFDHTLPGSGDPPTEPAHVAVHV